MEAFSPGAWLGLEKSSLDAPGGTILSEVRVRSLGETQGLGWGQEKGPLGNKHPQLSDSPHLLRASLGVGQENR